MMEVTGETGREEGTMPAQNKVGTQLLVSPHVKARGQALALVRQESVAEVWRVALEGAGLPGMEKSHAPMLVILNHALDEMGGDRVALLEEITRQKLAMRDLFDDEGRVKPVKLPANAA
jgi:hypothetical protein